MPFRYFIKLAFDGTRYHGWQFQDNAVTVQETLSKALTILLKRDCSLTGCGRTDKGVHAFEFYAHFDLDIELPETAKLTYQLNALLPDDIFVNFIKKVDENTHARFSATKRTYKYFICRHRNPFNINFEYKVSGELDIEEMNAVCKLMMNYTDFSCFSKSHTQVNNYNCKITEAYWTQCGDQLIFTITANRFLRNMVRAIVGTMLEIGFGKLSIRGFVDILENGDRSDAGASVPAKGLFLYKVEYSVSIF
jgi:tRNA pseudouridine38-40 synthase